MNKYELKITVEEIDSLIGRRRYKEAAEVADSVDWRRVKNVRTLCRVSDVYKINKRYDDSKKILELAYVKDPYARQIIFSMCELELKLGNYVRALQLYNEYINVAPRDADRFVLQYKLYKAQNVSIIWKRERETCAPLNAMRSLLFSAEEDTYKRRWN